MSVLPPKADIAERDRDVRFVPKADIDAADKEYERRFVGAPAVGRREKRPARDTYWIIQLIAACCGERRCLPLAKAFPRTYARRALRKAFAAFAADSKVA
jgi:hypothetical protein